MPIGDGRKTYSDSTLKSMTKDELIDIIRCLESNLRMLMRQMIFSMRIVRGC